MIEQWQIEDSIGSWEVAIEEFRRRHVINGEPIPEISPFRTTRNEQRSDSSGQEAAMRFCLICGAPIKRHKGESGPQFATRPTCSRTCGASLRALILTGRFVWLREPDAEIPEGWPDGMRFIDALTEDYGRLPLPPVTFVERDAR